MSKELIAGRTYLIDHVRKGRFVMRIERCGQTWAEGVIVDGETSAMRPENILRKGDPIKIRTSMIRSAQDKTTVVDFLNALLGEGSEKWQKSIYKGTDCGAWISLTGQEVSLGSIVEGSDACAETQTLTWPFTEAEFWDALQRVEDSAEDIWNEMEAESEDEQMDTTTLEGLRERFERGMVVLHVHEELERGLVVTVCTDGGSPLRFSVHRYFTVGPIWVVSVDAQNVSAAGVFTIYDKAVAS